MKKAKISIPNLFMIGVPKAGTTSIANYLAEHPSILMSKPKETCFHIREYDKGLDYYVQKYFYGYSSQPVVCDASILNMYFFELTAPMIYRDFPNSKLLVILRDPIDRAYSDYRSALKAGIETLSFEKTFEAEDHRLRNDQWSLHPRIYFRRGMYFEQIQKYLEYFDLNKIKFVIFEEFIDDPVRGVRDILNFLELRNDFKIDVKRIHNKNEWKVRNVYLQRFLLPGYKVGSIIKKMLPNSFRLRINDQLRRLKQYNLRKDNYPKVDNKFRERLSEYYAESNRNLEKELGLQTSKWWTL